MTHDAVVDEAPVVGPGGELWLDRAREGRVLARFLRPPEDGPLRPAGEARVLTVDAPPGHGAGTLVAAAAQYARDTGWTVCHARPRPDPGGPTLLPDLGGCPGRMLREIVTPTVIVLDDAYRVAPAEQRLLTDVVRSAVRPPVLWVVRTWRTGVDPSPVDAVRVRPGRWDTAVVSTATGLDAQAAGELVEVGAGIPAVLAPIVRELRRGVSLGVAEAHVARRRYDADAVELLPGEAARLALGLAVVDGALSLERLAGLLGVSVAHARAAAETLASAGLLATRSDGAVDEVRLRECSVSTRVLAAAASDPTGLVDGSVADFAARAAELAHRCGADDEAVGAVLAHVPDPPSWAAPVLVRAAALARARGDIDTAHGYLTGAQRVSGEPPTRRDRLRLTAVEMQTPARPGLVERRLAELVRDGADAALRIRAADQVVLRCPAHTARGILARALHAPGREDDERATLQALYWSVRCDDPAPPDLDEPAVDPLPELPPDPARAAVAARLVARAGGPRSRARVRALARLALGPGGDRPGPVVPRLDACRALVAAEDHVEARTALDRLHAEYDVRTVPVLAGATWLAITELESHRGRLGLARVALAAARRALPADDPSAVVRGPYAALPVLLALSEGCLQDADAALEAARPPAAGEGRAALQYARGLHHLVAGRPVEAHSALRAGGRELSSHGLMNPSIRPWRSFAALGLADAGRHREAIDLARRERELARDWGSDGALGWATAIVGVVGGPSGRPEAEEGIELLRRSGLAHRRALALTLLARDDHPDRTSILRRAASLADESGALGNGRWLRTLLRSDVDTRQ